MKPENTEYIAAVEAILFAGGEPVPLSRIAAALDINEQKTAEIITALCQRMKREKSGLEVVRLNDSYQLVSRKDFEDEIRTVFELRRNTPLSPAAFEVLSVVAYNQPVTKAYVEQVRGVDCSGVMASLVNKGLIEEAGRLDLPGRPIIYSTTDNFLRCFGISDLNELPPIPEPDPAQSKPAFETGDKPADVVIEPTINGFSFDSDTAD